MKPAVIMASASMLDGNEEMCAFSNLDIDYLKNKASQKQKGLFMNDLLHEVLGGKSYGRLNIVFPFLVNFWRGALEVLRDLL